MAQIVRMTRAGGTEVLEILERELAAPAPGEVLIRQTAIGVNFIDIYHRTGLYPMPPSGVLGVEAAGVVEAVGSGVAGLEPGQHVVYAGPPAGSYATERVLPAERVIPLPSTISDEIAAASMIKGLTVHMLLTRTYQVGRGTTVLVHAAAGGVGTLLTKWAKRLGATVFGTVGSDAKAEIARANGTDHVIVGRQADFVGEVRRRTDGVGVDVAYDGIGGTTLRKTFECVRRFGMVANIGQAGGPIPPLDINELGPVRSLTLARPSVMAYASEPDTYRRAAAEVFEALRDGVVPAIGRRYPLEEAAQAHGDLEAGRSSGSLLLIPATA